MFNYTCLYTGACALVYIGENEGNFNNLKIKQEP